RTRNRKQNHDSYFTPPAAAWLSPAGPSRKFIPMKVLVTPMTLAGIESPYIKVLRDGGFEPKYPKPVFVLTETELLEALRGVCATIAGSEPYTPRVFAASPQLRVVA